MDEARNRISAEEFLAKAALHNDGKSFMAAEFGSEVTHRVMPVAELLFDPIMGCIKYDDADALQGIFDFADGLGADVFSIELPLVNLETNEETMVSMPEMCFAMDREACFSVALDRLLAVSKGPNEAHPLLHSLFGSIAPDYGDPGLTAQRARMAEELVVGFMEVADSQGQLQVALTLPLPPKILEVAYRVAARSGMAKMSE